MALRAGQRIRPCLEATTDPECPAPALTRDLHEEIFLRVASPGDLARASAACVAFHRLVTDPAFLRRHRSIHPPLLLGFISPSGFQPAEPPHPSAAVAAAVSRAADFSFDYIPRSVGSEDNWSPCGVRDGHVLVKRLAEHDGGEMSLDFAVSDPLSRRYLLLPPVAGDLLASVGLQDDDVFNSGASFVRNTEEDERSFRVMCWMHSDTKLGVFFFSSGSGYWTVGASTSWDDHDLGLHEEVDALGSCQFVHGCFYWKVNYTNKLLKLDMNTMELSTYNLPPDHEDGDIVIVVSEEGNVAMFSQLGPGTSVGYYNLLQNGIDKFNNWHLKSTIPLPSHRYATEYYISGPAGGYIFLAATPKEQDEVHSVFFSLEIKTLKIERVSRQTFPCCCALPYFGFPPSMSPRRIEGYEAKDDTHDIAK